MEPLDPKSVVGDNACTDEEEAALEQTYERLARRLEEWTSVVKMRGGSDSNDGDDGAYVSWLGREKFRKEQLERMAAAERAKAQRAEEQRQEAMAALQCATNVVNSIVDGIDDAAEEAKKRRAAMYEELVDRITEQEADQRQQKRLQAAQEALDRKLQRQKLSIQSRDSGITELRRRVAERCAQVQRQEAECEEREMKALENKYDGMLNGQLLGRGRPTESSVAQVERAVATAPTSACKRAPLTTLFDCVNKAAGSDGAAACPALALPPDAGSGSLYGLELLVEMELEQRYQAAMGEKEAATGLQ